MVIKTLNTLSSSSSPSHGHVQLQLTVTWPVMIHHYPTIRSIINIIVIIILNCFCDCVVTSVSAAVAAASDGQTSNPSLTLKSHIFEYQFPKLDPNPKSEQRIPISELRIPIKS